MDQQQLDRYLRSVGKECFVKYFEYFRNPKYSNSDLTAMLIQKEGYTDSASRTRVSNSRSIINEGKAEEALNMIIESSRLDIATILKAKKILSTL
jgi:hypothetical protein